MNAPMAPISVKQRKPRTWLRILLVLIVVGVVGALVFGAHTFKGIILKGVTAQIQATVPTVATAVATSQLWQASQSAVGSLRASNGANLSAEIGGVVDELHFESGQTVPAGFVLLHLRGNDDPAKLAQLQAAADIAAVNLRRDQRQLQVQGVAQSVVDSDAATLKQAQAQVAAQQAIMAEKIVRAPFAGKLGVRLVDLGQYLAAGTTIVTLQALDPMFIDFYLPQQALDTIKVGQKVSVAVDAYPGRAFDGEVLAINPLIDATSRMLQVRATVHNPDGALLPGMFATASAAVGAPKPLVTIPQAAVSYNPYGSLVYVVLDGKDAAGKPQKTVRQQFVTTGDTRGDQVSILKGVNEHDVVVTAGQLKLHNGSVVAIDNSIKILDNPAPTPQDR